jgi:hypothetical protein
MIKSKRIRWEGHVVNMGERRNANRALVGKPGDHYGDMDILISRKQDRVVWIGLFWLRIGRSGWVL